MHVSFGYKVITTISVHTQSIHSHILTAIVSLSSLLPLIWLQTRIQ